MRKYLKPLRDRFGPAGLAALALLAAALAFSHFVVRPLEQKSAALQERLSRKAPAAQPGADKVGAVYRFLQQGADTPDSLAKLHGIGTATGVQLKSASYRQRGTEAGIVRYEIVLPASGSYAQIRDFLSRALAEIPVLSLDSLSLKRKGDTLQAEMRLTLHRVDS
jgi:Tfp pilus assembly protein PilO